MVVAGQGDNIVGCVGDSGDGKDLELIILLPQPCVEISCACKARVLDFIDIPQSDLTIERVKVNEESGICLYPETMTG